MPLPPWKNPGKGSVFSVDIARAAVQVAAVAAVIRVFVAGVLNDFMWVLQLKN